MEMQMTNFVDNIELKENVDPESGARGSKLVWRNLNVYAKIAGKGFFKRERPTLKRIINNCNGSVESGTLLALMGSSGAGKSTLMSALAYRNARESKEDRETCDRHSAACLSLIAAGIVVKGEVLVDDTRIGPFMHRQSGFVHQDDLFNGALTVLEHITFMVLLHQQQLPRE